MSDKSANDPNTKEVEILRESFPINYNIVKESRDEIYLSSARFTYIKFWVPKIILTSLALLILSTTCVLVSLLFLLLRPDPKIYTTNDRGEITLLKSNR